MADEILLFTVDEANAMLPMLTEALDDVTHIREEILRLRGKMEVLHLLHGQAVLAPENSDYAEYGGLRHSVDGLVAELKQVIGDIHETGTVLKDVEHGLVDFYSERNGEIVFLCWKRGEPRVAYWHTLRDGFTGRQPLSDVEITE